MPIRDENKGRAMKIEYFGNTYDTDRNQAIWLNDRLGNSVLLAVGTPKVRAALYRKAEVTLRRLADQCAKRAARGTKQCLPRTRKARPAASGAGR
jgi:hypothetical protein